MNAKWNKFRESLSQITEEFAWLEKIVNDLFSKIFPTHPVYPQWSVWRLMVKIWVREVVDVNFKGLRITSMKWLTHLRIATLQVYNQEMDQ
jgi:hypothetical protein